MKSLFVGNMSFQTTEGDLRALFEAYGQVTRVHLATDRETGRARGFAFIEMPNDDEAAKAIAGLDGKESGGRILKVNEARPKGESGAPRGPRSGFGDRRISAGLQVLETTKAVEADARAAAEIVSQRKTIAIQPDNRASRAGNRGKLWLLRPESAKRN